MTHVDYPHTPGTLYDCPGCEQECHCTQLNTGQAAGPPDRVRCVHCAPATPTATPSVTVSIYTVIYAPWGEGDDEPEKIPTDEDVRVLTADDGDDPDEEPESLVTIVADYMLREGAWEFSSSPGWHQHGWWSAEPYEHPYTGEREEKTFHLSDVPAAFHQAVWQRITDASQQRGTV